MRRDDRQGNHPGAADRGPTGTAGEAVEVNEDGGAAELTVPPPSNPVEELIASGRARKPLVHRAAIHDVQRVRFDVTAPDVLDDLRKPY